MCRRRLLLHRVVAFVRYTAYGTVTTTGVPVATAVKQ